MLEEKFAQKGFVVLGWPEVGFVYVFSTKKIESLKDFQDLKMWIWGDDVLVNTLFKNLNVSPIPLSIIDVMQSLQTGLIEGVYCPPLSCIAMQWSTRIKYMLDLKIANVPGGVLINKQDWNKIPADYQKIIKDCAKRYLDKLTQLSRKENEEALVTLKKNGVSITQINNRDDLKIFEDVSIKTAQQLVGKFYPQKMLDDMLKYLAEAKEIKPAEKEKTTK
jgi:TRAP-type C4-dicarboxylate transport system substrate-binding protein